MLKKLLDFIIRLYDRAVNFTDKHHRLCKILVFFCSAALMMAFTYIWTGTLVDYNGDSKMYISIADNFLDNGHFIQTERVQRENFVVPFGYPAILTLIRAISRNDILIALVQYMVFGFNCVMLYCAERNFFRHLPGLSVLMHCLMLWRIHYAAPGCVITETWYIAPIIFCVWLLSRRDIDANRRLTCAFIAMFIGFVIRPLLGLIFFPLAGFMLWLTIRRQYPAKNLIALGASAALIMLTIAAINYRETGHIIFTEAYSGISVYLLNNDNVASTGIVFDMGEYDYADDRFWEIYNRTDIDYCEKNDILSELGYAYILSHPLVTVKNVIIKLVYMFGTYWYGLVLVAAAGVFLACRFRPRYKTEFIVISVIAAAVAVVTSFGIVEPRYCYAVFPFYTLFTSALVGFGFTRLLPWLADKAGKKQA